MPQSVQKSGMPFCSSERSSPHSHAFHTHAFHFILLLFQIIAMQVDLLIFRAALA